MKQISGKGKTTDGMSPTPSIRGLMNKWVTRALLATGLSASVAVAAVSFSNSTLFTFDTTATPNTTGANPNGQMIQASDGNYYGVTCNGGTNSSGVVWEITPAGQETVLHTFAAVPQGNAQPNVGGGCPQGVVQRFDGRLWGVAQTGGANGGGTVFSLGLDGSGFTVVHDFGNGSSTTPSIEQDGRNPHGSMMVGEGGSLYGTTLDGGSYVASDNTTHDGAGTIFKIPTDGSYQNLYSFGHTDPNDGEAELDGEGPIGNLVQGADGNLYGVTFGGGTRNAARDGSADDSGGGIAYRFDQTSAALTVLHAFKNFDGTTGDGYQPFTNLVETADGAFYGMTAYGGSAGKDDGTLFRISSAGAFTLLNSFTTSDQSNGTPPQYRGLMLGSDGNIYGTTLDSDNGAGIVFQLVPNADGAQPNAITTVHEFEAAGTNDDSGHPGGPTVQGSDGSILGSLSGDVNSPTGGNGEIFHLSASPALVAPVQLSFDHPTLTLGQSPAQTATLSWNVLNATSQTYSTCFATDVSHVSDGNWSGLVGPNGSKAIATSGTSTPPGTYRFALTCGGVETGSATLTILPAQTPAPTVTITANPTSIVLGNSSTLNWSSTNATTCSASGAWNGPEEIQDTQSVTPAAVGTYTYTLTCTGDGGSANASATLMVKAAPVAPTVTISVNPASLTVGKSATLNWSSTNATSCTASNAWSGGEPVSGSQSVQPAAAGSYTYTLTCTGDGGSANASATLTVKAAPVAPTVTISVNPASITVGSSAALMWSSTNATSCTASNAWSGGEPTSGMQVVQPATAGTYTYLLTCTGDGGESEAAATLTVNAAGPVPTPPTVTIGFAPSNIVLGTSSSMLSWSSTGATACSASDSWSGNRDISGSLGVQPSSAGDFTYTLTCTGAGGSATRSATLHVTSPEVVNPPPPPVVTPPPTGSLDVPVKTGGGAFGAPVLFGMLGLAGLRRRRKAAALLLGLALSGIGTAQADGPAQLALDPVLGHLYGGVRLGEMNLARDNGKLYRELHNAGYDVALNQHKNAFAGTAYLGFQVDSLVGFELGYTHRDGTVTTITGPMPANLQGLLDTAVRQQRGFGDIYSASIRLHGEILPRLVLSPRLGTFYWTDKTTAQADGLSAAATHSGGGITVGTSVNYRIWRGLEVGTSIDFFGSNRRNDGTLFAGNVEWDFGK